MRDRAGNMYWADRGKPMIICKRTPEGAITDFCKTHDFRDVRWMTASAEGTVYLIDDDDLRRIAPDGDLWLLEYSTDNAARVRQIGRNCSEKIY